MQETWLILTSFIAKPLSREACVRALEQGEGKEKILSFLKIDYAIQ